MKYKSIFQSFFLLVFLSCQSFSLFSQVSGSKNASLLLREVMLVDIAPAGAITLSLPSPSEAGNGLTASTINNRKWLNYTCAIATGASTRNITAALNHEIPGMDVQLKASSVQGKYGGITDMATSQITLHTVASTIITGIGGAYTGDGIGNGHQISISIMANKQNYGQIRSQNNTPVQIIYTISSN